MDTFIQLVAPWMANSTPAIIAFVTIVASALTAIVVFALTVLVWHLYFAAIAGLKCLNSYFTRKEIVNTETCEKFCAMLRHFAEVAREVRDDARVNVLNRDDSVQYATLKDIPEKEQIHHRIVRVGGDHPVDYIYSAKTKEWAPLFGDITLGLGAPALTMKDIKDLNIKTRIPGQRICVPEVYKTYMIDADGEAVLLPAENTIPSTTKKETIDGESD